MIILLILSFLPKAAEDHILVKFMDVKAESSIVNAVNTKILKRHSFGYIRLSLPKGMEVKKFLKVIKKRSNVVDAIPDYIYHATWVPSDSFYVYQWNFRKFIHLEDAWEISRGGEKSIIVAIIDTGCSYEEYDIPYYERGKVSGSKYHIYSDYNPTSFVQGYDFVNDDSHPNDNMGHGTHISGTIAEATDNLIGLAGIAFNVKIMPVKVLDNTGSGYLSDIVDGIKYATDHGAKVINLSLGANQPAQMLEDAINYAYNNNVVIVAAAGNDGNLNVNYPAKYDGAIAVAAYDSTGSKASYSNAGTEIEIAGPGGNYDEATQTPVGGVIWQQVFLPYNENSGAYANLDSVGYFGYVGTSQATAHVSALAALILSVNPGLTNKEVRTIIDNTAQDIGSPGRDIFYGYGRPNFYRALLAAQTIKNYRGLSDIVTLDNTISGTGNFKVTLDSNYVSDIRITAYDIAGRYINHWQLPFKVSINISLPHTGVFFIKSDRGKAIKLLVVK